MDSHKKPCDTDFTVRWWNEADKNSAKSIQKFSQLKAGRSHRRPLNTPLVQRNVYNVSSNYLHLF